MNPLRGYAHFAEDAKPMTKILIASALMFSGMIIPFVGHMVVVGWMAMTLRASVRGEKGLAPLDWDIDRMLFYTLMGIESSLVLFVWTIPFVMLALSVCLCGGLMSVLSSAATHMSRPLMLGTFALTYVGAVLVIVLGSLPGHVAAMRVMLTGEMEEGFRVGEIFRFTGRHFWPLAWGLFATWVVGIPVTLIGVCFCFVGAFPAYVLTHVSSNDVLAQVYVRDLANDQPPLVLGPDAPPTPM